MKIEVRNCSCCPHFRDNAKNCFCQATEEYEDLEFGRIIKARTIDRAEYYNDSIPGWCPIMKNKSTKE